jgi:hypothetical protein
MLFLLAIKNLKINNLLNRRKPDWNFNTDFLDSHKIYLAVFVAA